MELLTFEVRIAGLLRQQNAGEHLLPRFRILICLEGEERLRLVFWQPQGLQPQCGQREGQVGEAKQKRNQSPPCISTLWFSNIILSTCKGWWGGRKQTRLRVKDKELMQASLKDKTLRQTSSDKLRVKTTTAELILRERKCFIFIFIHATESCLSEECRRTYRFWETSKTWSSVAWDSSGGIFTSLFSRTQKTFRPLQPPILATIKPHSKVSPLFRIKPGNVQSKQKACSNCFVSIKSRHKTEGRGRQSWACGGMCPRICDHESKPITCQWDGAEGT